MTRIRYKKQDDGILKSKYFKSIDDTLYICIYSDFSFKILNPEMNSAYEGKEKTLNGAKKAAKEQLILLGVSFENEVRPRIKDELNENARKQYESENRGDK